MGNMVWTEQQEEQYNSAAHLPSSEAISVIGPFMVSKIDINAFLIVRAFLFLIDLIQTLSDIPSHKSRKPIEPYKKGH